MIRRIGEETRRDGHRLCGAVGRARIHGSLYVDPRAFDDEMARVFARGWVFVGHESEIPGPGDWVTRRIGREPVILVRDRDGNLHVLANRCAHRGTTLCWTPRGRSRSFQCTYHGWTFSLGGELKGVPHPGGFHGRKSELGLDRPGQVGAYRDFVFANLSGDAGALEAYLGDAGRELIDRLCDLSPTGRIRLAGSWIGHRIEANWKMIAESDNDGYHVPWVHASMVEATPDTYYQEAVLGTEPATLSLAVDHGNGHLELDLRPSYATEGAWLGMTPEKVRPYAQALERAHGAGRAKGLLAAGPPHALIFPNLFLGEMNLARIEPWAPGLTIHHHSAVQLEGVDDAFNQRLLRQSEAALGPASFIVPDDAVTAERMQRAFAGSTEARPTACWIDLGRGLERERCDAVSGRRTGHVTDETTNRAFWRQYRDVMIDRA